MQFNYESIIMPTMSINTIENNIKLFNRFQFNRSIYRDDQQIFLWSIIIVNLNSIPLFYKVYYTIKIAKAFIYRKDILR